MRSVLCNHSRIRLLFYDLESSAKNTDIPTSQKPPLDQTRGIFMRDGKFRTSCCPWSVVKFWYQLVFYIAAAGLIKYISKSSQRAKCRWSTRKLARIHQKPETKNKKRDNDGASRNRLQDLPEWLEVFTDNLEDAEVPAPAHMTHDLDSSGKHSICLLTSIENVTSA